MQTDGRTGTVSQFIRSTHDTISITCCVLVAIIRTITITPNFFAAETDTAGRPMYKTRILRRVFHKRPSNEGSLIKSFIQNRLRR
jgi:hypothetical protein